jgi:hypothetical protein
VDRGKTIRNNKVTQQQEKKVCVVMKSYIFIHAGKLKFLKLPKLSVGMGGQKKQ